MNGAWTLDLSLVVPESVFHKLRAKYGEKVKLMLQPVDTVCLAPSNADAAAEPAELTSIPSPRLGYLGPPLWRLNRPLLASVLKAHPEWHFISVGPEKAVDLPNAHTLPWVPPAGLRRYAESFNIGFMPYDCYQDFNLHCVPLKLFEYFTLGMPVVSTPIINLWEYKELVYFGDTAEELASATEVALREPADSPKRAARIEIAHKHSLESLATMLRQCLPLQETQAS